MKKATKLRKQLILETYRKDFPDIRFYDVAAVTLFDNGKISTVSGKETRKLEKNKNYLQLDYGTFIHKSLIGIEDNNGWVLIEPDGSNLPNDGFYEFLVSKEYQLNKQAVFEIDSVDLNYALRNKTEWAWSVYSHFKLIEPKKLPFY